MEWHKDLLFSGPSILINASIPERNLQDAIGINVEPELTSSTQEPAEDRKRKDQPDLEIEDAAPPVPDRELPLYRPAQRLYPLFRSFIMPINDINVPYFSRNMLRGLNLTCIPLRFDNGGLPAGHEMYIKPMAPETIDEWIRSAKPESLIREFNARICLENGGNNGSGNNYTDAMSVWKKCIAAFLSTRGSTDHIPELAESLTRWKVMNNGYRQLDRRGTDGVHWSAEGVFHFCVPGGQEPDTDKPHVITFVADDAPLVEGTPSTSALQSIMWLHGAASAQDFRCKHNKFPVTVVCCSGFKVRIVQGVADYAQQSVELRLSEIADLQDPRYDNWDVFMHLLAWFLGEPVGETLADH